MKRTLFLLLICFLSLIKGYSQTKQELIKELIKVMHQDSVMDKTFSTVMPTMMAQMQLQAKDSASRAHSQELMTITMPLMKDLIKKMDVDLVAIYDYYFNETEINDFIAFYKSPSGQKLVKSQPLIQRDMMTVMYQKYMPEMKKVIKEKMDEMKERDKK